MKKKFRKGARVKFLSKEAIGSVVSTFTHWGGNWCVVEKADGFLVVESEYDLKKIPPYIKTLLDLAVYEDQQRIVASVAKCLAANSPYMDILKGGKWPANMGRI